MVSEAAVLIGGIDGVIANAGIYPSCKVGDITEEYLNNVVDVNFKGTVYTVQSSLPHLKSTSYGRTILISSITGPITGIPEESIYEATKAAQLGFMRTLAIEIAETGIIVNAVLLGNIVT